MTSVNILKPNKDNLSFFLVAGALFFTLGLVDFCLNNFYDKNITGFLPGFISFFTPLIFGMIGLHLIRIEFSGIKILDELNKNINTNNFNAALSMSIIILIIFGVAPLLNWFILDANFVGESKKLVQVVEPAGYILKYGSIDLFMECTLMLNNGELMLHL